MLERWRWTCQFGGAAPLLDRAGRNGLARTRQLNAEPWPALPKAVRDQILDHLRAEPKLTRNALAERVGRTPDGVKYHLAALKEAGALRRIGSARGGYWEVL